MQAGLGHLYLWRPGLALAAWATWAAVGALTQWVWSEPRGIITLWADLAAIIGVNLALAWHAWHLARTATADSRPSRARLAIVLISVYAVVSVIGSIETRWIKRNVVQAYRIPSTSMEPSLLAGDWEDSRYYGFISIDGVTGHPTQVYFSYDGERGVARWNRFGRRLDE